MYIRRNDAYHHAMRHDVHLYEGALQNFCAIRPGGLEAPGGGQTSSLAQQREQTVNAFEHLAKDSQNAQ